MARTKLIDLTLSTYELRTLREVLEQEVEKTEDRPGAKARALEKIDVALHEAA